jgi:hypothetical protein
MNEQEYQEWLQSVRERPADITDILIARWIRQHLNGIRGYAEIYDKTRADNDPIIEWDECFSKITKAVQEIHMIADCLVYKEQNKD